MPNVSVDCVPVMLVGLNAAVTPVGTPLAVTVTGVANPLSRVTAIVAGPVAPCCRVNVDGETASVKEGAVELKVAVTIDPARGVNVHVRSVPVHWPAQLANALPFAGAAVSVTSPGGNDA
jgi:hypothetical protein